MLPNLYDVLSARGFIAQSTEPEAALRERLGRPQTAYIGFDPTADSFHVGSLVPIMGLYWLQQCGHRPLAVIGGATALIGDPSGKNEARKMLSPNEVASNITALTAQIARLVRFDAGADGALMLNNADWLGAMTWIDLLREAGPHFSVNRMLSMDSVKNRLEGGGITFLEFNYMVMQAYDFLHLRRSHGCTLEMGGQDQWGNIVMGVELVRRTLGEEVVGLTFPLVTKSDGTKFGKSEKGNIWLAQDRTPPYEFYQFWRNVADADLRRFLGIFTTVPMAEVDALCAPGAGRINEAKEVLAFEVTRLIHGATIAEQARGDSRQAFGATANPAGESIPHAPLALSELASGVSLIALLVRAKLATSTSEARRLIDGGGVRVQDRLETVATANVTSTDLRDGYVLIRAGKKRIFRFDVS